MWQASHMSSLKALIERREEIRRRIVRLQRELEMVEHQLFARVEKVAAVLDGDLSASGSLKLQNPPGRVSLGGDGAGALARVRDQLAHKSAEQTQPPNPVVLDLTPEKLVRASSLSHSVSFTVPGGPVIGTRGLGDLVFHRVDSGESFRPRPRSGQRIAEAAARILRREGRPLRTPELFDKLYADGVVVPGSRPKNNLAAHLSNAPNIVSTEKGWELRPTESDDAKREDSATPA